MVDIHCHILPGVDDGSRSWEMTREMCRIAADDGIRHIVATPHCNNEYPYDRERYEGLKSQLEEASEGRIEFSIGCDFHFSYENITDAIANPLRYSINGTRYLLIEFSDYGIPPNVAELFFQFTSRGMVPIITHPERNPLLVRRPRRCWSWLTPARWSQAHRELHYRVLGRKAPGQVSEWLLAQGAVHVVASDAHDPKRRRPRLVGSSQHPGQNDGPQAAEALVNDNPQAIVEDQVPLSQPEIRARLILRRRPAPRRDCRPAPATPYRSAFHPPTSPPLPDDLPDAAWRVCRRRFSRPRL